MCPSDFSAIIQVHLKNNKLEQTHNDPKELNVIDMDVSLCYFKDGPVQDDINRKKRSTRYYRSVRFFDFGITSKEDTFETQKSVKS